MMTCSKNTEINGKLWIAGRGKKDARILFVAPCVLPEDVATEQDVGYGRKIAKTPRILEGAPGIQLKAVALKGGIKLEDCYFTNIVKYLPENKAHQQKPTKTLLNEGLPYLEEEINHIKPSIIVCVGKQTFDVLATGIRAQEADIQGAWFYSDKYQVRLYAIPKLTQIMNPEMHERFLMDFRAIRKMDDSLQGVDIPKADLKYEVIHNAAELKQLTNKLRDTFQAVLSVDCEWHGNQHVDGNLRSLQIAWSGSEAAYIRFMDDQLNYVFDVDYATAGAILGEWLNEPFVKYIGHHISADLMWMHYWLKLDWFNKSICDTEFAQQCIDESASLGLDDLALRYTDLGKYDWDLIWWKKKNGDKCSEGYGYIPDDIMIPYAVKDVITVYRAWPILMKKLKDQDLVDYYERLHNPFVTDVFTFFGLKGLPIDRPKIDEMRKLYNWALREITKDFQTAMAKESEELLEKAVGTELFTKVHDLCSQGKPDTAKELLKQTLGADKWFDVAETYEHYLAAPNFNIRSKPQMVRWLFTVKKYVPVKSTANKAAGMPATSWDKVLAMPPDKQLLYTPATDTETLDILSSKYGDKVIDALLRVNAVGNICKAFLKESELDADGKLVKEKGLHYWIASDDAMHLNHSCTETGRARSWNPNVLNWPSYIKNVLGDGIVAVIRDRYDKGQLPSEFHKYKDLEGYEFPTVRSVCMARPGWCIVEADYQTAEMRALAYIAGDRELLKMILEPDDCFALVKPDRIPKGVDKDACVVRLKYPEYVHFPEDKEKYIMTYTVNKKVIATFTEDDLDRDEFGNLKHPKFDMHWQVCELSRNMAREMLHPKYDRGAAKVTNFSSSYGGTATSIARKIAAITGVELTTEEAEALLLAVEIRQKRATEFFKEMERAPIDKGFLRAASGRIRHCHVLAKNENGLGNRERNSQIAALGRECRNFFMQESVGASAALACYRIVELYQKFKHIGLQGYPFVCLYDSIVIHCPEEERFLWQDILDLHMNWANGWAYPIDILRYPTDCDINAGWSTKPDKARKELLHNHQNKPLPDHLQFLADTIKAQIEFYKQNKKASVFNKKDLEKYDY